MYFFSPDEAGSARKQLAEGLDTTVTLANVYATELAPNIQPALVEKRIVLDVPELSLPLSGMVDVLSSTHWLPDLKTASSKWSQAKADSHIQLTIYRELIKHETGEYPSRLSFELFIKTKKPYHHSLETTRRREDFDLLVIWARQMMQMVNAGIFPPAEPGHWCCSPRWCGYWWTCVHIPAHRKILPK